MITKIMEGGIPIQKGAYQINSLETKGKTAAKSNSKAAESSLRAANPKEYVSESIMFEEYSGHT